MAQSPNQPLPPHLQGFRLLQEGRLPEAEAFFRRIVELNPRAAWGFYGLGRSLLALGRGREGIEALRQAANLEPTARHHWLTLLEALLELSAWPEAVEAARALLALDPDNPASLVCLARALIFDRAAAEAEACLERAIERNPEDALIQYQIGFCLQSLGRTENAEAHFRRSIELDPKLGSGYCALAYIRKVANPKMVYQIKALTEDSTLPLRQAILLRYALGKSLQDQSDFEGAMTNFDEANRLDRLHKFGPAPFDRIAHRHRSEFLTKRFNREFIDQHRLQAAPETTPIFVIGMIRSGTTLVEQILASHPDVGGAGELRFWMDRSNPQNLTQLPRLAEEYIALLQRLLPGKKYVVDKMPDNYALAPLIHMALPNAKFIHIERNSVDTCLSIYTTPNEAKLAWLHDKQNIVFAYRDYQRLMSQWRKTLPSVSLLEIRYEDLVFNQAPVTRQLIEFCGLEWNTACLHPEASRHAVVTPSHWQVRQPVYTASVARWRNYEPYLGPFADLQQDAS